MHENTQLRQVHRGSSGGSAGEGGGGGGGTVDNEQWASMQAMMDTLQRMVAQQTVVGANTTAGMYA